MSTYLITGTSKGVGLCLAQQLLALPAKQVSHVFALSRSPPTPDLQTLLDQHGPERITHITGAVDSDDGINAAAAEVRKVVHAKGFQGLDVLVNNAGIGGPSETFKMEGYSCQQVSAFMETNVVGVHRCIVAFLPLLREGREKKIINM